MGDLANRLDIFGRKLVIDTPMNHQLLIPAKRLEAHINVCLLRDIHKTRPIAGNVDLLLTIPVP